MAHSGEHGQCVGKSGQAIQQFSDYADRHSAEITKKAGKIDWK
jgi:hypothetical protein